MTARMANCAKSVLLVAFPDGPSNVPSSKKGQRVGAFPFTLCADGMIRGGTMHRGGLYRIIKAKAGVKGDDRTAILARRGELVFGEELDADPRIDARPVGKSARLDVPADRAFSAFFEPHRRRNGQFIQELSWMFSEVGERIEAGRLNEGSVMDSYQFMVAAGPRALRLRWDNELSPNQEEAQSCVAFELQNCARAGTWDIPGFSGLTAEVSGVVEIVDGDRVVIKDEQGNMTAIDAFRIAPKVRSYIATMTGVNCDDLPVVPVVWEGKPISPSTCLFGPATMQAADVDVTPALLEGTIGSPAAMMHRMRQLHAWATLTCGEQHGTGAYLYPLELVEPDDLRRTYVRLAGGTDGGAWDHRVQVNLLAQGATSVLQSRGIGFEIDLFDHSQRTLMLTQIKRSKAARAAGGDKNKSSKARRTRSKPRKPNAVASA